MFLHSQNNILQPTTPDPTLLGSKLYNLIGPMMQCLQISNVNSSNPTYLIFDLFMLLLKIMLNFLWVKDLTKNY